MNALTDCTHWMLDISTPHVTLATSQWIERDLAEENAGILNGTKWFEYGWILWVNDDESILTTMPHDLACVMRFARSEGFAYLKLDADGQHLAQLPHFEWENLPEPAPFVLYGESNSENCLRLRAWAGVPELLRD